MPTLDLTDGIHVLDLGADANLINPAWIEDVSSALDEVLAAPAPRGLVTTGSGKFFSFGLDLEWMAANPDGVDDLVAGMHELFARMLELPAPTVAALQQHTFAGGALFALTHDYRVMRRDRGYFGLPEVDARIVFTLGATDLVRARLAPQVAHEAMTSGRRYTGEEAAAAGIVDELAEADEVVARAIAIAKGLGDKDPQTYGAIRARLHRDAIASLRDCAADGTHGERFREALEMRDG